MPEEIKTETMELVVTACEKHSANNEVISTVKNINNNDSYSRLLQG